MEITVQIILSTVTAFVTSLAGYFLYKIKKREFEKEKEKEKDIEKILIKDKAIIESLRALCRDRILQGYRYYKEHDGITMQDLETMTKLYKAYHNLGGNGTLTAVYEKILNLPIKAGV